MSRKQPREPVTVFVDTNVLLHGLPFDQINWTKELAASAVTLRVPLVVVDELDKQKIQHPLEHMRERAQTVLARLHTVLIDRAGAVRRGVSVVAEDSEAWEIVAAEQLDRQHMDDRVLAAVLRYRREHPDEPIVVATGDGSLAVRLYARGIRMYKLPDNLRRPRQQDPKQKELRQLRQTVEQLQQVLPQLRVTLPGGETKGAADIPPPRLVTTADAWAYVNAHVAPKFPLKQVPEVISSGPVNRESADVNAVLQLLTSMSSFAAHKAAIDANDKRDRYFSAMADYHLRRWDFKNFRDRTLPLHLVLKNIGGAPGEDIYVFLWLPAELPFYWEGQLPTPPQPPLAPGQVRAPAKQQQALSVSKPPAAAPSPLPPCQILGSEVVGERRVLRFHVQRLNHGLAIPLPVFYTHFPTGQTEFRFTVDYHVTVANAPEAAKGSITLIARETQAVIESG